MGGIWKVRPARREGSPHPLGPGGAVVVVAIAVAVAVAGAVLGSCADAPGKGPPAPFHEGAPWVTIQPGARYFTLDGRTRPLLMRNIAGRTVGEMITFLDAAKASGTRLVRFQLTQGIGSSLGMNAHGAVTPAWASAWDQVLSAADARDISVIPIFAIWGDWNDGAPNFGWANWTANPLRSSNGGPAAGPADLFRDTPTQQLWLSWMSELVTRWNTHANVAAWEIFSELDLASGVDETSATSFASLAADRIRAIDGQARPILASTSDLSSWQLLWASRANDLVEIHPYGASLGSLVLSRIAARAAVTSKPMLVAESGLDAARPDGGTATSAPFAQAALRRAIWAELVSGSATARALWWEDGYAVFFPGTGLPLVNDMASLEATVPAFLADIDFTGLVPAAVPAAASFRAAALARADLVVGWVASLACDDPFSACNDTEPGPTVTITVPAGLAAGTTARTWSVTAYDPIAGVNIAGASASQTATATDQAVVVTLPAFKDAVAFRAAPAP